MTSASLRPATVGVSTRGVISRIGISHFMTNCEGAACFSGEAGAGDEAGVVGEDVNAVGKATSHIRGRGGSLPSLLVV